MRLRRRLAGRVYYGWVVVAACLLASMAVFGTTYAFGVFYDSFLAAFDASRTSLAVVFGLQTALIYVAGVAAGRYVDRYGGRRVAAASTLLLVVGLCWSAAARSYLELLVAFGVVAAVGMAGLYVVGYATVPLWFERRRGTAAGIASTGLGIGLVVVPAGADLLVGTVGWRGAMLAVAGAVALLGGLVALLFADSPSDVGADASVEFPAGEPDRRETNASADRETDDDTVDDGSRPTAVRETVLSAPFLLVFVGWVLVFAPMFVVMSHVVLHAADAGIGRATGVLAITVIGVTTTVSRVGVGLASDRVGRTGTFVVCAAVMGAAAVVVGVAPTAVALLAVAAVFGVGYGGCGGLIAPLIADLFGDGDLNTLFAVASLSFAVSGIAAPPLAGVVFERAGSYTLAFGGFGVGAVVGAGCVAGAALLVRS